jgi:neuronal calcium sensor 1
MDRDQDAKLTFDEFVEGSKHDPTIVKVTLIRLLLSRVTDTLNQALSLYDGLV